MKQKKQKIDLLFYAFVVLFFSAQVFIILNKNAAWWDEAVYISMGKYIFSSGASGMWEVARPPVMPLIAGTIWYLGADTLLAGRMIVALFVACSVLLTYLIGWRLFGKKEGMLAAALMSITPVFFFFSSLLLSDIVSTFFALAALYFFVSKNSHTALFLSGILGGLALLARFPQIFLLVAIFVAMISSAILTRRKISLRQIKFIARRLLILFSGFILAAAPYLAFNQYAYGSFAKPFIEQIRMVSESAIWLYDLGYSYYLAATALQNIFLVFSVIGVYYFVAEKHWADEKKFAVVLAVAIFFSYFTATTHKELRYIIIFLPYLFMLASWGFFKVIRSAMRFGKITTVLATIFIAGIAINAVSQDVSVLFGRTTSMFEKNISRMDFDKGPVFSTTPVVGIYSDAKIEPIYFSLDYISSIYNTIQNTPGFVLIDTCDFPCPSGDAICEQNRINVINSIKNVGEILYYDSGDKCEYYMLKIKIS